MSGKMIVFLVLVAGAGYYLTKATPPAPAGGTAADSAAVSQAGIGARFQYGLGALGSKIVAGHVHGSVDETEQALRNMKTGIKKLRGGDLTRAQTYSKKIVVADSAALIDLYYGRPVSAVRNAMEAKSLLGSVQQQVDRGL